MTRCLLQLLCIFCLLSSQAQHSREIHRLFLEVRLLGKVNQGQNLLFLRSFQNLAVGFQVLGHGGLFLVYAYALSRLLVRSKFELLLFHLIYYYFYLKYLCLIYHYQIYYYNNCLYIIIIVFIILFKINMFIIIFFYKN